MEARTSAATFLQLAVTSLLLVTLVGLVLPGTTDAQQQFRSETTNFVVVAPSPNMASKAAGLAEKYRKELSMEWLGYEIENWSDKCPIHVRIGPHAGGETSFAFIAGQARSEPIGWRMQIFGPPDRVLDAVLPHEITHTIFATHFGRPLPRWADEGACTTVEHASEREKNHHMLLDFLTSKPSRGIPFNRMFTMKQYPHDILPLYAQGYSVAKYLIAQKGRRSFIKFLEAGIENESSSYDIRTWNRVTREFYGFKDLSDLQISWQQWVREGSDEEAIAQKANAALAGSLQAVASAPNANALIASEAKTNTLNVSPIDSQISKSLGAGNRVAQASAVTELGQPSFRTPSPAADKIQRSNSQVVGHLSSWYAKQSQIGSLKSKQPVPPKNAIAEDARFSNQSTPFLPGSIKKAVTASADVSPLNRSADINSGAGQTIWR